MFVSNIKIAVRNIIKDKFHSLINIFGLALSVAAFLLIVLYLKNEISYDSQHKNIDKIYSVNSVFNVRGNIITQAVTQPVLPQELKTNIPEIKYAIKINEETGFVEFEGKELMKSEVYFTDPDFFKMFSFSFLRGDSEVALSNKQSVVISKNIAEKKFGVLDAIGKTIKIKLSGQLEEYIVTGVIDDIPDNSSLKFDIAISFEKLKDYSDENYFTSWGVYSTYCFIQLQSEEYSYQISDKINEFINSRLSSGYKEYSISPLKEIHWGNETQAAIGKTNNFLYIQFAVAIAVLIILIASVNYSNLNIAKVSLRLKEIAIKKVMGASRSKLISQYLFDSIIIAYIAFALGLIFAEIMLPGFNNLLNENLVLSQIFEVQFFLFIILFPVLLGIISGLVPAFITTKYSPDETFRNKVKFSKGSLFNKVLMSFQFSVSLILLIVTLFMGQQINFIKEFDIGINSDQVMVVELDNANSKEILNKYKLNNIPGILNVASSNFCPGYGMNGTVISQFENKIQVNVGRVDENFISTLGFKLLEGRDFSIEKNDNKKSVLINKKLAKLLNNDFTSMKTNWGGLTDVEVIGVIDDFYFETLHSEVGPMLFYTNKEYKQYYMYLKLSKHNFSETISKVKIEWSKFNSEHPFNYFFLDESFDKLYSKEQNWYSLLTVSSFFAILISLSGLIGFTSLITSKRVKEIVIRKVIGASAKDVISMLSKDYIYIIAISSIISLPVSYFITSLWLENFAFKIPITISIFIYSVGIITFLINLIVVLKSYKSYLINPVNALRNE